MFRNLTSYSSPAFGTCQFCQHILVCTKKVLFETQPFLLMCFSFSNRLSSSLISTNSDQLWMCDTDRPPLIESILKIRHVAASCSLWHCPWGGVMDECVGCFPHHVMLVMASVSCCNSMAGRALGFPLSLSLSPHSAQVVVDGKGDIFFPVILPTLPLQWH